MDTVASLRVLASAAMDISISFACGLLLAETWLGAPASPPQDLNARPPHSAFNFAAAVFFLAAWAQLLLLSAAFTGGSSLAHLFAALPDIISTHAGKIASLTISAAFLLLVFSLLPLRRSPRLGGAAALLLLNLFLRSAGGHAGADGDFTSAELLQSVHLTAMALWSGGVLVSGLLILPRLTSAPVPAPGSTVEQSQARHTPEQVHRYVSSLSIVSTWAVIAVILSGLVKAYRAVDGDLHLLNRSLWGYLLIAKLAVVAATLSLGALNRRSLSVDLPWNRQAASRCARTLRLEACSMLAVLLLSALLAGAPPPGE